jgi:hypothetical protein
MIITRNTRLPASNTDLNDAARTQIMKPTIDDAGNWTTRPAAEIDGNDKRVVRAIGAA